MKEDALHRIVRISLGIIFIIPGIFKLMSPDAFLEYLNSSPIQIPGGMIMFYPVTLLEIIGGVVLILNLPILVRVRPLFYLMFIGVLLVATITVVIPDATNMFADQIEMANLYHKANPDLAGLNVDIFPSKIGLINILFHLLAIALLVTLFLKRIKL